MSLKPTVKLITRPKNFSWLPNKKTIVFEEMICLEKCRSLVVDCHISAEISNLVPNPNTGNASAYNVYKLFIDGVQVGQSGFEAEADKYAPNLGTASLMWSGSVSCYSCINVKVTAELKVTDASDVYIPISNINNALGGFQGAKGASLRLMII